MPLDDVRTALREQADAVPAALHSESDALTRAHRKVRRRRVSVAAIAVFVIAGTIGAIATVTRSSKSTHVQVSATPTTVPAHKSKFTDEQMRAHDGIGVPSGWQPVDAGSARVFVPGNWVLERAGACIGAGTATGMVGEGEIVHTACDSTMPIQLPEHAVSIFEWHGQPTGPLLGLIHGYHVYVPKSLPPWTTFEVPELGVKILTHTSLSTKIINTLAPSSQAVVLAQETKPTGRTVDVDGIRITIPESWPVDTPDFLPCYWPTTPAVLRIGPHIVVPSCPMKLATAVDALHDGLYVWTSTDGVGTLRNMGAKPLAVLHHGETTISVNSELGNPSVLDLLVKRAGSTATHLVQLGLGPNGRVAAGVLASIEAYA